MAVSNDMYYTLLKHVKTIYGFIDQDAASQSSAGKEALEALKWFVNFEVLPNPKHTKGENK